MLIPNPKNGNIYHIKFKLVSDGSIIERFLIYHENNFHLCTKNGTIRIHRRHYYYEYRKLNRNLGYVLDYLNGVSRVEFNDYINILSINGYKNINTDNVKIIKNKPHMNDETIDLYRRLIYIKRNYNRIKSDIDTLKYLSNLDKIQENSLE